MEYFNWQDRKTFCTKCNVDRPDRQDRKTFCTKCNVDRPDRAHHCKLCKRCVLKMDHHCPWGGT
ncbi:hypothetical protein T484DRAFT_1828377 [Baffinella frigidus]|nr:hypothetical protein T484DRAFT_1828377 [Cryptophyta sp. CCMP2293]